MASCVAPALHPSLALSFRRIPGKFRPGIPPGEGCMAEKQWMTYSQIAERLGVTPDAIRHRSRKEGWQRQEANDGKIRVLIDPELLSETPARTGADSAPESDRNSGHDSGHSDREIRRLEDQSQMLLKLVDRIDQQRTEHQAELAQQRAEHAAELERLRDELKEARKEAADERGHSRELYERLDQLHREHRLELERVLTEWERARRPWFRRWFGR
jgi:predicted transcriptional regulator